MTVKSDKAKADATETEATETEAAKVPEHGGIAGGAPPSEPSTSAADDGHLPRLQEGDDGKAVRCLQGLLIANGAGTPIDGRYGKSTATSVASLQERDGLTIDGKAGPKTVGRLLGERAELAEGVTGQAVRNLQGLLRANGFAVLVDGRFAAKTRRALAHFQERAELEPSGVCDAATWKSLLA